MQREAILLAGGQGARLFPYTSVLPKPLLPIAGKQILAYIIEDLWRDRFNKFYIAINESDEELFRNYLGQADDIEYVASKDSYNTAGRLRAVLDEYAIDDMFLLHYGDIITDVDYDALWRYHSEEAIVTLVVKRGWPIPKGMVVSEDGTVTEFIERYPLNEDIWTGVAVCTPEIVKYIDYNDEDIGGHIFPRLIEEEEIIKVFQFDGFFLDIGTYKDYQNAIDYLRLHGYNL